MSARTTTPRQAIRLTLNLDIAMRLLLLFLVTTALAACSDSSPSNTDLQKLMSIKLPAGMAVKSIEQQESIDNENDREKTSVAKFKATLELSEPHYEIEKILDDDVAVVTLKTDAGSLYEVIGVATSTKIAGDSAWTAVFENQSVTPQTSPGIAKSQLGKFVIKGSEEESALIEKLELERQKQREARAKAQKEAEVLARQKKEESKRAAKQKIADDTEQLRQLALSGAQIYGTFSNGFNKYQGSIKFNKTANGQAITGRRTYKDENNCWFDFTGKIERGELIVAENTTIKHWCYPREWTYKIVNGAIEGRGYYGNSLGTASYELD